MTEIKTTEAFAIALVVILYFAIGIGVGRDIALNSECTTSGITFVEVVGAAQTPEPTQSPVPMQTLSPDYFGLHGGDYRK